MWRFENGRFCSSVNFSSYCMGADPGDSRVLMRWSAAACLLELWNGFESGRGRGYLSFVSVVCCQLGVSASG